MRYKLIKIDDGEDIVIDTSDNGVFKTYFTLDDFIKYIGEREEEWNRIHSELWDDITELKEEIEILKANCGDKRLKEISNIIQTKLTILNGEDITKGEYNAYKDLKQRLKDLNLWRE